MELILFQKILFHDYYAYYKFCDKNTAERNSDKTNQPINKFQLIKTYFIFRLTPKISQKSFLVALFFIFLIISRNFKK